MEKIYAYDKAKQKMILAGMIQAETFIKSVKNNHYVKKYRGYGISKEVINILKKREIKNILIKSKKNSYLSKVSQWEHIIDDLGNGEQCFVPVNFMEKM